MTLLYVVLCDVAGETFPVAVCPDVDTALRLTDKLNLKAIHREVLETSLQAQVGRPTFRAAEAPAVDLADAILTLVDKALDVGDLRMAASYAATVRRGIKLGDKL